MDKSPAFIYNYMVKFIVSLKMFSQLVLHESV